MAPKWPPGAAQQLEQGVRSLQVSVRTKLVRGRPVRPTLGLTINRDVEYRQVGLALGQMSLASAGGARVGHVRRPAGNGSVSASRAWHAQCMQCKRVGCLGIAQQ